MIAQNESLELTAGNLANTQSPGYLAQVGTFTAFPTGTLIDYGSRSEVLGQTSSGVVFSSAIQTDGGGVQSTSNSNDLAIDGQNGFFVVQTPTGLGYTRDGQFSLDANGRLVTSQGYFVLGTNGKPITAPSSGGAFTVSSTGVVTQGTKTVGTLALYDLPATGIQSLGNNLYTSGTRNAFTGAVVQSALNTSNVSMSGSMSQLIDAQSWYQALTQMVNEESKRLATVATMGILS